MKVLAIMGCRKNGNTEEMVRFFSRELQGMDPAFEVEYLYLTDVNLPFCTGCHNCIFIGEEKCPHHRIVKDIEDRMLASDGVILATPGYMFSVQGIMKNFLDHVAYNCHRPKYFGKPIFILSACSRWQEKGVFIPMETWAGGAGFRKAGKAFVEMYPFPLSEKELEKRRIVLRNAAAKFHKALRYNGPIRPEFGDLMIFQSFRTLASLFPTILQADLRYFQEKKAYDKGAKWYVPARIPFFKYALARFIGGRMRKGIAGMADMEKAKNAKGSYINRL
jgi:hypothetical protein